MPEDFPSGAEHSASTREAILGQVAPAYQAYSRIVDVLNHRAVVLYNTEYIDLVTEEDFGARLDAWLTDEKLRFVKESTQPEESRWTPGPQLEYTLVATPSVALTANDIMFLAADFAAGTPNPFLNESGIRDFNGWELSGGNPLNAGGLTFSLIASNSERLSAIKEMAARHDFIGLPSILEAIAHWYVLRDTGKLARQVSLDFDDPAEKVYSEIVHYELGPVAAGVIATTGIRSDGSPRISIVVADDLDQPTKYSIK